MNEWQTIASIVSATAMRLLLSALAGWLILQSGCSRPPTSHTAPSSAGTTTGRVLSPSEAADLAVRLANDQCDKQFHKRPFTADRHEAVLKEGVYHWGGLDVGGPGGFSALVTFQADGSQPHVEVYYSTDLVRPRR